jgi:hypothetical protein
MKGRGCLIGLMAVVLISLTSCDKKVNEPSSPVSNETSLAVNAETTSATGLMKVADTAKKGGAISLSVKPLLRDQYCPDGRYAIYQTFWELENQYRVVSGKKIGVGFDGDMSRMQNYINQYQFNLALISGGSQVGSTITTLVQMGYLAENIIVSLDESSWQTTVSVATNLNVHRFYIDEPVSGNHQALVQACVATIAASGSTLTISEMEFRWWDWYVLGLRGNIGAMIDLAQSVSPSPYVSCHTHFDNQAPIPPGDLIDPRDQWTYIMGRAPSLFKMAWIKTRQSQGEIGELFGHANNIGLSQIILLPFDDNGNYIGRLDLVATAGKSTGWMQQFEKQYTQQWCCPTTNFDPGVCTLYTWWYTGVTGWY